MQRAGINARPAGSLKDHWHAPPCGSRAGDHQQRRAAAIPLQLGLRGARAAQGRIQRGCVISQDNVGQRRNAAIEAWISGLPEPVERL